MGAKFIVAGHLRDQKAVIFCQRDGIYFSLEDGTAIRNPTGEPPGCLQLFRVDRENDEFVLYFTS